VWRGVDKQKIQNFLTHRYQLEKRLLKNIVHKKAGK